MAVQPSAAGSPAIELNGLLAGLTRSLQMPGYRVEQVVVPSGPGKAARLAANISISTMAARIDLGEPGPLLEWALSLPRGNALATDGAALVLDANRKVQRRVEWSEGLITELKLPMLDASSKLGFSLDLTWQPSSVSYSKPSGERLTLPGSKRKPILTSTPELRPPSPKREAPRPSAHAMPPGEDTEHDEREALNARAGRPRSRRGDARCRA